MSTGRAHSSSGLLRLLISATFVAAVCLPWVWIYNFHNSFPDATLRLAGFAYLPGILMSVLGLVGLLAAVFRSPLAVYFLLLASVLPTAYVFAARSIGRGGVVIGAVMLLICALYVWREASASK